MKQATESQKSLKEEIRTTLESALTSYWVEKQKLESEIYEPHTRIQHTRIEELNQQQLENENSKIKQQQQQQLEEMKNQQQAELASKSEKISNLEIELEGMKSQILLQKPKKTDLEGKIHSLNDDLVKEARTKHELEEK